jgi:hypothetical protein
MRIFPTYITGMSIHNRRPFGNRLLSIGFANSAGAKIIEETL